ncbi:hypothetical protein [Pacificimonas flava]|uniref:Acetyltransferase n=1 Tax=Pacificimonas flava TaxID=1234595 RepID=M2TBR9_9SPHN|nr:hypothetical protein [Pacificimonas flava]EMD84074.1 hypothetical protein C725_0004 [Pacificimonas flava]MBB5280048.1 hypothetical protein [Pacificimonas flava]
MADYDVFNGDADGICSLIQLRLAEPRDAALITGVKRDIALLSRLSAAPGDRITALDISMRTNGEALRRLLDQGAAVFYADHHNAGEIPDHPALDAAIDTGSDMCTALIVSDRLGGAYERWALAAAFGDGLAHVASARARSAGLTEAEIETLARLGTLLNYNGYGASVGDLHFPPDALYGHAAPFACPFAFIAERPDIYARLDAGYREDMDAAEGAAVIDETPRTFVIELPDAAASRRVSGVFGNRLAETVPGRAHAILTASPGGYVVSVRAPHERREGADTLCLQFESGGGRAGAAGINHLPRTDLDRFVAAFRTAFGG